MYNIVFTKQSVRDLESLKQAHLSQKARVLIDTLKENPFKTPPAFEKLVGNLTGAYSRRINIQHRLVYQVYEEPITIDKITYDGTVKILHMWTHYGE